MGQAVQRLGKRLPEGERRAGDAPAAGRAAPSGRAGATTRRDFSGGCLTALLVAVAPAGLSRPAAAQAALSNLDASRAVRLALERGVGFAVDDLGRPDGFMGNPAVRIGLPGRLQEVAQLLRTLGQGARVDELVLAMNRAAEQAVPQAKPLLLQTARQVTLQDAVGIVRGGETSITDYFASRTRSPLTDKLLPIVRKATEQVDLARRVEAVMARVGPLAAAGGVDSGLVPRHVTSHALDAVFRAIGEQERNLRQDPVGSGSALLRRVLTR